MSVSNLLHEVAKQQTYLRTGLTGAEPEPIEPGSAYLTIQLRAARVEASRRGLDTMHAVVHSSVSLSTERGQMTYGCVIAPPDFGNRASRGDRFICRDRVLFGPAPYLGGTLTLEVGVFAVKDSDLAKPYIDLLLNLGQKSSVPLAAAAAPFVEPLAHGVNLLLGGGRGTRTEIGLSVSQLQATRGRIVALHMPAEEAVARGVTLSRDGDALVDATGNPLSGYASLTVEIQASARRENWWDIPELGEAHERIRAAYRQGTRRRMEVEFDDFRRIALTCVDLIPPDRTAVVAQVEQQLREAGAAPAGARDGSEPDPSRDLAPLRQLDIYGSSNS